MIEIFNDLILNKCEKFKDRPLDANGNFNSLYRWLDRHWATDRVWYCSRKMYKKWQSN